MISAYVGLPGAGKSYAVVANVILPALKEGRRVVTNIPLHRDAIRELTPKGEIVELPLEVVAMQPETINDYVANGSVLVLDEAWRLWPAGVKSHQVPEAFRSLLAEHRHRLDKDGRSVQIIIVTQDLQQISAWARSLIEITFVHTQLGHVGANKKYVVGSYRGAVDTIGAPESRKIRSMMGTYRANVFKLYQSHTMRDGIGKNVDEKAIDQRATIWRRPILWVGLGFVIVAPAWAVTTLVDIFSDAAPSAIVASEASHDAPAPVTPPARERRETLQHSAAAAMPSSSTTRRAPNYRVAGIVRNVEREREGFVMIEREGRHVVVPLSSCSFLGDGLSRCAFDGFTVTEFGVE